MKASIDFINKSDRDIFANYEKDGKQIIIKITTYKGEPIIKVLASTIDGKLEEIDEEFWEFRDFAKYYKIEYSLEGWAASYEIDCSKSQFKLSDVIELINHTDNNEYYSTEVTITHVDRDTYKTTVPPLNISDNTLKKQAEYNANELIKALNNDKKKAETEDTSSDAIIESKPYTLDDFNNIVQGVDAEELVRILRIKKAVLLISPPGTGKTTTAIELARYITKETNSDKVKLLSFNQTTSYSDVIGGYRTEDGTTWLYEDGELTKLSKKALKDSSIHILILDEINRANTESVLGEAITALSKRGEYITTNNGSKLCIPDNLYVIATMNSTDNSITSLDTALADRFAIYRMEELNTDCKKIKPEASVLLLQAMKVVADTIKNINKELEKDVYKGKDNTIGNRALYTDYNSIEELITVVEYDIKPKVEARLSSLNDEQQLAIKRQIKELISTLANMEEIKD